MTTIRTIIMAAAIAASAPALAAYEEHIPHITHMNIWGDFDVGLTMQSCPDKRWNDTGWRLALFQDAKGHRAMGCWMASSQRGTINYFWIEKTDKGMHMPPEMPINAFQRSR